MAETENDDMASQRTSILWQMNHPEMSKISKIYVCVNYFVSEKSLTFLQIKLY
jgi:hypothetical protein